MSFQLSPEVLISEANNKITQLEAKRESLLIQYEEEKRRWLSLPTQIVGGEPSRNTIFQNAINAAAKRARTTMSRADQVQIEIANLEKSKILLQKEADFRNTNTTSKKQSSGSITTPPRFSIAIPQPVFPPGESPRFFGICRVGAGGPCNAGFTGEKRMLEETRPDDTPVIQEKKQSNKLGIVALAAIVGGLLLG